jgi:hypothetical protein
MKKFLWILVCFSLMLVGCQSSEDDSSEDNEDSSPSSTESPNGNFNNAQPTVDTVLQAELANYYTQISASQAGIAEVWTKLQGGEAVACSTPIYPLISFELITGQDELSLTLRRAAEATNEAIRLWEIECQKPRPEPSPDVINQGVLAALGAGDALREAELLLNN